MLFLAGALVFGGLIRLAAPHIKSLAAARELAKPGMTYMQVAVKPVPVDGVWAPEELGQVIEALKGGDQRILEIGKERIEALISAGCPVCTNNDCRKLFPHEGQQPDVCDRCGHTVKH